MLSLINTKCNVIFNVMVSALMMSIVMLSVILLRVVVLIESFCKIKKYCQVQIHIIGLDGGRGSL